MCTGAHDRKKKRIKKDRFMQKKQQSNEKKSVWPLRWEEHLQFVVLMFAYAKPLTRYSNTPNSHKHSLSSTYANKLCGALWDVDFYKLCGLRSGWNPNRKEMSFEKSSRNKGTYSRVTATAQRKTADLNIPRPCIMLCWHIYAHQMNLSA